jgi:hypothetical protein
MIGTNGKDFLNSLWMPAFAGMTVLAYFSGSATPTTGGRCCEKSL